MRLIVVALLALSFPVSAVAAVNSQIWAGDGGGVVHRGDPCSWSDWGQIAVSPDGYLWCTETGQGFTGLTWE